jgi:hypothetical protein
MNPNFGGYSLFYLWSMSMASYTCGLFILEAARDPARLKEAIEADRYWERYLASNSTVMAHTFQVQTTSNSYYAMETSSGSSM